ncbi:MAG TPA: hypothetical protein VM115_07050 [Vicinamibacterales bacterium]|nr:hypothetical protein [Vicinamibacterales bacterium]
MAPIHLQVLEAVRAIARRDWTFDIRDVVAAVPHLNAGTVRTHVASRCCANAPSNHQSRHPYFTVVGRGVYRLEPRYRRRTLRGGAKTSQDVILDSIDSGVDPTLVAESLAMTPTERLETMRRAVLSLDAARRL